MNPFRLTLSTLAAAVALAVAPAAFAATEAHDHGHAAVPAKPLPAGQKWASDAPLRQGMTRIRGAIEPKLGAIHAGKLDAAGYAAIARQVESQVGYIVSNCKLAPEADAALHGVLAEVTAGVDAMAGRDAKATPEDGAVKLVAALDDYGRLFKHAGWKPMPAGH